MTKSTEWLIRIVAVILCLYFGWEVTSKTALTIIQQNVLINKLQTELTQRAKAATPSQP